MYLMNFLILFFVSTPLLAATTDQSYDLNEVMELGQLSQSDCQAYWQGQRDEQTTLRCGKWMFFYDPMGRPGFPAALVDLLRKNAPENVGKHLEGFGMIDDPYSKDGLPLGLTPSVNLPGFVPTYALTCAGCHFAKLPDGRYQVGHPNHDFDYSGLTMALAVLPQLAMQPKKALPPKTKEKMQPLIDEFFGRNWGRLETILQTLRMIPSAIILKNKPMDDASLEYLAKMPTGVLDPLAPPAFDDHANVPLRILPVWGLPRPELMEAFGSKYGAMLTSSGGTPDLSHVYLTGAHITDQSTGTDLAASFDASYYEPLTRYILSLKAPKNQQPVDIKKFDAGERIFAEACVSCHRGPAYGGTEIFSLEDIGTDPALKDLYGPNGLASFMVVSPYELTYGVRAPRLEGFWSLDRILHNGSLRSFAELLCLEPRPASLGTGHSTAGHDYACETYSRDDKEALIHFLESL